MTRSLRREMGCVQYGGTVDTTEDDRGGLASPRPSNNSRRAASLISLFEDGVPVAAAPMPLERWDAVVLGRASGVDPGVEALNAARERRLLVSVVDPKMSKVHAQIRWAIDGWCVEDASSRNGTRVNGERVERATLSDGDVIQMGHSVYLYRAGAGHEVASPDTADEPPGLGTFNPGLARQFANLRLIARSTVPVLVQGETGTGKELAAKAVHRLSGRKGALRAVNCGALPRTLLESELFGYRKGAFSGASEDRLGLVRSADNGTLFLDEVGDLPLDAQGALLRVLQEGEVLPVGSTVATSVDVRIVAATHRDLANQAVKGRFREDLLARLTGFSVVLPPLRERREDLGALIHQLIGCHAAGSARDIRFTTAAIRALCAYEWPGNIRQLGQVIRAALVLSGTMTIDVEHLGEALTAPVASGANTATGDTRSANSEGLKQLLTRHRGNVSSVALALHTSRMQVHRLCKRFGIDLREFRSTG